LKKAFTKLIGWRSPAKQARASLTVLFLVRRAAGHDQKPMPDSQMKEIDWRQVCRNGGARLDGINKKQDMSR
jgi:hypothetical protein